MPWSLTGSKFPLSFPDDQKEANMTKTSTRSDLTAILSLAFLTSGIFLLTITALPLNPQQEREKPLFNAYKGVTIGMPMDEARAKLGSPRDKSDSQDLYVFSDDETVLIYYNPATKTVDAVTITYTGKLNGVPDPKAVFGDDAEVKPDGGIFKMVRYPKAGYWVSYNKIMGDDPMVLIAMKKL
jgi:hypothetical protein